MIMKIAVVSLLLMLPACARGTQPRIADSDSLIRERGHVTPTTTITAIVPAPTFVLEPGKGAVVGTVNFHPESWRGIKVFLAPFYQDEASGSGFYVLEPSLHPHATVQPGGSFQMTNVDPGSYVMVIGSDPAGAFAVEANGETEIFQVTVGETVDVGQISYSPNQGAYAQ